MFNQWLLFGAAPEKAEGFFFKEKSHESCLFCSFCLESNTEPSQRSTCQKRLDVSLICVCPQSNPRPHTSLAAPPPTWLLSAADGMSVLPGAPRRRETCACSSRTRMEHLFEWMNKDEKSEGELYRHWCSMNFLDTFRWIKLRDKSIFYLNVRGSLCFVPSDKQRLTKIHTLLNDIHEFSMLYVYVMFILYNWYQLMSHLQPTRQSDLYFILTITK